MILSLVLSEKWPTNVTFITNLLSWYQTSRQTLLSRPDWFGNSGWPHNIWNPMEKFLKNLLVWNYSESLERKLHMNIPHISLYASNIPDIMYIFFSIWNIYFVLISNGNMFKYTDAKFRIWVQEIKLRTW